MKTILVTGGCGFIGSHLVRLLLDKTDWNVVNLDLLTYAGNPENLRAVSEHSRYIFVRGDITDVQAMDNVFKEVRPSIVVNLAADSHVDRSILDAAPFLKTNVVGVQVLLDAARRYDVERFLQMSTDEVYGDREGQGPCAEDGPLAPSSPYAASKASADLVCHAYRRTYNYPVLIVRSSNNYGPFQFPEKLIPLIIKNILSETELPIYGDGMQRREWLYVEDAVQGILDVVEGGQVGNIYNLSSTAPKTNLELVQTLCNLVAEEAGLDPTRVLQQITMVADRPGHDRLYAVDVAKVRDELGWVPKVSLESGLKTTVRWYLENRQWVERVVSGEYQEYYRAVYGRGWEMPEGELLVGDRSGG